MIQRLYFHCNGWVACYDQMGLVAMWATSDNGGWFGGGGDTYLNQDLIIFRTASAWGLVYNFLPHVLRARLLVREIQYVLPTVVLGILNIHNIKAVFASTGT